jgi:putative acetyltransferase
MPTEIVIRRERPDHPQVVAALSVLDEYLASLYPPDANHILSVDELLASEVSFYAAWHGERVVGTAAVCRRDGEPGTEGRAYGEIKRMYVQPDLRGRRLGRRLIDTLEADLRARRIRLALLETGKDQREAIRLYERCGYVVRSTFGGYPDNGLSLFMQKALAA